MAVVINDFEVSEPPQAPGAAPAANAQGGGAGDASPSPAKTMKEVEKSLRRNIHRGHRLWAH